MSTLPEGWMACDFGEVVSCRKGKKPRDLFSVPTSTSVPYLLVKQLDGAPITQYTDDKSVPECQNTDVLLAWDGSVGKNAVGLNGAIGSTIAALTPIGVEPKLIQAFLELNKHNIQKNNKGSTIPHVDPEYLWNLQFPIPPELEQKRIAQQLDIYMLKTQAIKIRLEKILGILKRFRKSILSAACTGRLTADWRDASIPVIPKSTWKHVKLKDLFEIKSGGTPYRKNNAYYLNGNVPWVKTGEVRNSDIYESEEYITDLAIKETNAKIFPPDTLLIAMYGEGKTRGQIGRLKIKAATNQACAALVNIKLPYITNQYVFYFLLNNYSELRAEAVGGNQPNLNLGIIKEWDLPLPSEKEQAEIVRRVEALLELSDNVEAKYKSAQDKIDKLAQSILAKAFRGELVPQVPTDEPASALYEKIKGKKKVMGRAKLLHKSQKNMKPIKKYNTTTPKKLHQILKIAGKPLPPGVLFRESQLEIDDFYSELKEAVISGVIKEKRIGGTVLLEAK